MQYYIAMAVIVGFDANLRQTYLESASAKVVFQRNKVLLLLLRSIPRN